MRELGFDRCLDMADLRQGDDRSWRLRVDVSGMVTNDNHDGIMLNACL